jgi:hypothetical protein
MTTRLVYVKLQWILDYCSTCDWSHIWCDEHEYCDSDLRRDRIRARKAHHRDVELVLDLALGSGECDDIEESMRSQGWDASRPICISFIYEMYEGMPTICDGHHRLALAWDMGLDLVPVLFTNTRTARSSQRGHAVGPDRGYIPLEQLSA